MQHTFKFRILALLVALLWNHSTFAQLPTTPGRSVSYDPATNRVNQTALKFKNTANTTWESGSTFQLNDGTSFTIGSTAATAMKTALGLTNNGTRTFANAAARAAAVPDFTGQLGIQLDTEFTYKSTSTAAGAWGSVALYEELYPATVIVDDSLSILNTPGSGQPPLSVNGLNAGVEIVVTGGSSTGLKITHDGSGPLLHMLNAGGWRYRFYPDYIEFNAAAIRGYTGSVSLPGYSFYGDTHTGIYSASGNTVSVATAGANRATFSSAGLDITGAISATDAATTRTNLGTAKSGANSDITSLTGLTATPAGIVLEDATVLREDFIGGSATSGEVGELGWTLVNTSGTATLAAAAPSTGRSGIMALTTPASAGSVAFFGLAPSTSTAGIAALSTAGWEFICHFKQTSSVNQKLRIGFFSATNALEPADGIWMRFDTASSDTTYQFVCRASSTQTTADSGVAVNNDWNKLRIRSTTNGRILFSINDGTESTISTNVSGSDMFLGMTFGSTAASTRTVQTDLVTFFRNGLSR